MLAGIVPANARAEAKTRLASRLERLQRERFVSDMLKRVVTALAESELDRTYLVSPDPGLLDEGARLGAIPVVEANRLGPDEAVRLANDEAIRAGASATLVLFSDIPLVRREDIDTMISIGRSSSSCVVAVRSIRGGTNALWRNPPEGIPTSYGENSFIKHKAQAENAGVPFNEFSSRRISLDIDTPEDLDLLHREGGSSEYPYLFDPT